MRTKLSESLPRPWLLALLGVFGVQIALALTWVRPGPLSLDEVVYQWMTRSATEGAPFTISNGYEELPSRELATANFMWARDGKLTGQYPLLFPLLAAPLHARVGFLGLFLLNAAAFAGVLALCWRIGVRFLDNRSLALLACVILAGGTYAWEYSMAAWPHMITLLVQLAAFDLMLTALDSEAAGRRAWAGLLAGALLGVAVGFRRDAVFFLPVVALPLLFARPLRLRALGALMLGALPPLALIAWLNWIRWGIASPLSYGRPQTGFRVLGVVGVLGLVGLTLLSVPRVREALLRRPKRLALAGVGAVTLLFVLPFTHPHMVRALHGVESILFDLGGFTRASADGSPGYEAVAFVGGLKKSLLQSLPWLPLLAIPVHQAWRDPARRRTVLLLSLPVVVYVGIPIFLDRHGGMSLNLRYVIPALPFLALLAAFALGRVWASATGHGEFGGNNAGTGAGRAVTLTVAAGASALVTWGVVRAAGATVPQLTPVAVFAAPLVLALVMAVATILWMACRDRTRSLLLLAVSAVALTWSGALAFDYDARWSRDIRAENLRHSLEVAELLASPALLFVQLNDLHATVPEYHDDVIVAFPGADDYADFRRLATFHLDRGRRVYAALSQREWAELEGEKQFRGFDRRRVEGGSGDLVEVRLVGG